ncbi:MAG: chorismate synthase, partial [Eggerthellaceae bacterium]|nr:chorismate synthase [Eggerthellaceae bacterium]
GGHFSGRITAALVAAAAIVEPVLEAKGIKFGTHITMLHGQEDRAFEDYEKDIEELSKKAFPCLCEEAQFKMISEIESARDDGDSVGGVLESAILNLPAGLGEPWFDSMESMISHMLFSIGGIKGVEFGAGFALADMFGSQANDNFEIVNGNVATASNNNGGINGGISNGMPVTLRCAVKPTPSIFKDQQSVNIETGKNETLQIKGRHDPAIIHRVKFVVDAALRLVVADILCQRFGTDYLGPQ